ncbi:MAG: hypothetical protein ABIH78_01330 [Candidatus Peregrinibacteria bacterium]
MGSTGENNEGVVVEEGAEAVAVAESDGGIVDGSECSVSSGLTDEDIATVVEGAVGPLNSLLNFAERACFDDNDPEVAGRVLDQVERGLMEITASFQSCLKGILGISEADRRFIDRLYNATNSDSSIILTPQEEGWFLKLMDRPSSPGGDSNASVVRVNGFSVFGLNGIKIADVKVGFRLDGDRVSNFEILPCRGEEEVESDDGSDIDDEDGDGEPDPEKIVRVEFTDR